MLGHPDGPALALGVHLAGPQAARGAIAQTQRRGIDHAQYRPAPLDQGDIDGELAVALDELLGAVEGIHQPVAPLGVGTGEVAGVFLRQQRQWQGQGGQAIGDKLMGGGVRLGQGGLVGLLLYREVPAVDGHDGGAGVPGDGFHLGNQFGGDIV